MKKVDLMIFDLDGTLVSSGADLIQSINYTLNAL
jgi:phosphoglycolate phosphatase-like HAD superfamily hydrolase